MTTLREQIDTPLAIDDAFAFVADFANSMHWDPGVATSERIDAGPVGVGARYRLGIRLRGRVAPMEYRISVYEPNRRVVLVGEGSGVAAVDEIRFTPRGTGTHIDYVADIRLQGADAARAALRGRHVRADRAGRAGRHAAGARRARRREGGRDQWLTLSCPPFEIAGHSDRRQSVSPGNPNGGRWIECTWPSSAPA